MLPSKNQSSSAKSSEAATDFVSLWGLLGLKRGGNDHVVSKPGDGYPSQTITKPTTNRWRKARNRNRASLLGEIELEERYFRLMGGSWKALE